MNLYLFEFCLKLMIVIYYILFEFIWTLLSLIDGLKFNFIYRYLINFYIGIFLDFHNYTFFITSYHFDIFLNKIFYTFLWLNNFRTFL